LIYEKSSSGPVKNINPGSAMGALDAAPWMPRGTTYPSSYILTESPPPISSFNVYRPNIECPPTQAWRVPDPYDCSIYHDCYHGTDLVSHCSGQLQYNPEKQLCDHAENVQCNENIFDFFKNEFLF
jgi:hypothetical protein